MDFFVTKDHLWFDPEDRTPVQAVLRFKGLRLAKTMEVVQRHAIANHWQISIEQCLNGDYQVKGFASVPMTFYASTTEENLANFCDEPMVCLRMDQALHKDLMVGNSLARSLKKVGARPLRQPYPLAMMVLDLTGHEDFLSAISGLPKEDIFLLDKAVQKSALTGDPVVVRYYLDDREKEDPEEFHELRPFHGDAIVTRIPANTFGQMPLVIAGNSVVYHARFFHGRSLLGRWNPGLINEYVGQALALNKYVETLFWQEHAPLALPETHLLANLNLNFQDIANTIQGFDLIFPEGWVLKSVNESSSNFSILTDKTNLAQEIKNYQESNFEQFKIETYQKMAGFDEDNIYETLQEHPNYIGWKAYHCLQRPTHALLQKRLVIAGEFRVEAIAGKILAGATVDRHNWLLKFQGKPEVLTPPEMLKKAEDFAQSLLDKLPREFKETNFGFDIACLKSGECIAIETNFGTESGFLINMDTSVAALNNFLRTYPKKVSNKEISAEGLSAEEQMEYLRHRFAIWKIHTPDAYPASYSFDAAAIEPGFNAVEVPAKWLMSSPSMTYQELTELTQISSSADPVSDVCSAVFRTTEIR